MELIDKAALVAEIQKLYDKDYLYLPSNIYELKDDLLAIIDELEVKEVDLDKIIKEEYFKQRCYRGKDIMLVILNESDFNRIAKHFFELGLKTQKGE